MRTDPVLMLGLILGNMERDGWPIHGWSWPENESKMGGPYVCDLMLKDGTEFRISIVDKEMMR